MQIPSISPADAWCVTRLGHLLLRGVAGDAIVSVRNPVRLSELSEPVPDLSLIRPRPFHGPHPVATELLLVVEVSDGTLAYDRGRKIPLYGRRGVLEVWILDLRGAVIYSHREPVATGYQAVEQKRRGESIAPEAFPGLELSVD